MARTHQQVALTVLVVAEVPNFWSGFLPSLFTIATFSAGDESKAHHTRHWIRRGEVQAIGLSLALGVSASLLSEDPWPFIGVLVLICYLAYQYEHALRLGLAAGPGINIDQQLYAR
jgi:hypothetical protein